MRKEKSVFICSLLLVLCSLLLLSSCEDMFQQKIPHPGKNDSLDNFFVENIDISKLSSPGQFYIAPYYSSTEIRLTWNEVRGAAYYMVERAVSAPVSETGVLVWEEPDDGDYEQLDRYVYGTFFIDTILRTTSLDSPEYQNRYYYRVSAYNPIRKYDESEPCEPQFAMLFRAPQGLTASGGTSVEYVQLQWDRTAGASSYDIFRSELSNGTSASFLGNVWGNQTYYQNRVSEAEQGIDYYYMVIAQNNFGNKTLQTRPAYGYAKMYGAPDAPETVKLKDGTGRGNSKNTIEIEWDDVLDAEYYSVYRYSSADSSLTLLEPARIEATHFTDSTGLKPGVYYYYKIQAIVDDIDSGKALKSQFSDSDPEGFILSPPETVVAEKNQNGSVTVKWLPAIGRDYEREIYGYKVYADAVMSGTFPNLVYTVPISLPGADGYISATISGSNTFFRVTTVNGGIESDMSITVAPAPDAAIIEDATRYANIPNGTANSNGVYPVKITWKKPENESPAFYHVQRSTRSGSGFSRINETALSASGPFDDVFSYNSGTGIYTYIDRNDTARPCRKFYYRVLSLNQLEQGNFPSGEKTGWGALTHNQYMLEYNRTMTAALKKLTYMHKPGSTEKLGTETKNGALSGSIYYNAAISGLGARIIISLTNYSEYYIDNDPANGVYFTLNGNSNTSANMSSNGDMDGTVTATGMYPGSVKYDGIQIKGGNSGGGSYVVTPEGFPAGNVPYNLPGL